MYTNRQNANDFDVFKILSSVPDIKLRTVKKKRHAILSEIILPANQ